MRVAVGSGPDSWASLYLSDVKFHGERVAALRLKVELGHLAVDINLNHVDIVSCAGVEMADLKPYPT